MDEWMDGWMDGWTDKGIGDHYISFHVRVVGSCETEPLINTSPSGVKLAITFNNNLSVDVDVFQVDAGIPLKRADVVAGNVWMGSFRDGSVIIVKTKDQDERHLVNGVCQYTVYTTITVMIQDTP